MMSEMSKGVLIAAAFVVAIVVFILGMVWYAKTERNAVEKALEQKVKEEEEEEYSKLAAGAPPPPAHLPPPAIQPQLVAAPPLTAKSIFWVVFGALWAYSGCVLVLYLLFHS